ncbi:TTLL11 [Symbiodinium sp. CCMP2456]|nr:TTLL11 [Symbiodinium sp. CCMP2456]
MSDDEEARLFQIQERVPLWVSECLPMVSRPSSAIVPLAAMEVEAQELTGALESVPDAGDASLASARPPSMSPPMYQKSPPVPVLWHISPENFQRRVSRLDTRQLVLALRYAAADGAGLLAGGSSSSDPAAQRALTSATGQLPRRHRSRSRAQQFVGALLEELVERVPSLRPAQACSAVKSIASLKALAGAPLASSALEALASGPLAGWKIATTLRPCDVALLLQGWSQLVADEGSEALTEAARGLLRGGAAPRLLALSSCALQEAGAPPPTLGSMCAGAAQLAIWQRSEGNGSLNAEMRRRLQQFLIAGAQAARDGPFQTPPGLRLPLSVLRAAGDAGMWNSEAFSMLAPMVTVLILGPAVKTRPPHHLRDWVPRLPRPGFVRGAWRPEELAEAAFLFARSSPLEGNVAAALSLTLLAHVSVLKEALLAGESQHRPALEEVDRRVLCFAEHSVEILRRAAREPFFEPWRPPKKGPGFEPTPSVERFEPEVLEDERMCVQIVWRWRKLSHAAALATDQGRQGARRRSAEVAEVNEALDEERLLRSSLLATAALAVFRGLGGAAGAASRSELLQTLTLRLAPSGSPARGTVRSWLRRLRLCRAREAVLPDDRLASKKKCLELPQPEVHDARDDAMKMDLRMTAPLRRMRALAMARAPAKAVWFNMRTVDIREVRFAKHIARGSCNVSSRLTQTQHWALAKRRRALYGCDCSSPVRCCDSTYQVFSRRSVRIKYGARKASPPPMTISCHMPASCSDNPWEDVNKRTRTKGKTQGGAPWFAPGWGEEGDEDEEEELERKKPVEESVYCCWVMPKKKAAEFLKAGPDTLRVGRWLALCDSPSYPVLGDQ